MKILHICTYGGLGGIQTLIRDIALNSKQTVNHICFLKPGGEIFNDMASKGLRPFVVKGNYHFYHLKSHKLYKIILENKYDLVVFHSIGFPEYICLSELKRKTKIPCFVYVHSDRKANFSSKLLKDRIFARLFVKALKKADKIISISDFVNKRCQEFYPNKKTVTIYNGIIIDNFLKLSYHSPEAVFKLLYVGRLIQAKGIQLLLHALKELDNSIKWQLDIVGDGDYRKTLEELSSTLGLTDRVVFHGAQTDVRQFYEKADLFIHPAIWNEGFGITLVEAMASGVPCLTFRKGAMPEIIDDNINGFLMDEVSAEALLKRISDIYHLYRTSEYIEIRNNGRKKAEKFSIEQTISNLEREYEKAIEVVQKE